MSHDEIVAIQEEIAKLNNKNDTPIKNETSTEEEEEEEKEEEEEEEKDEEEEQ